MSLKNSILIYILHLVWGYVHTHLPLLTRSYSHCTHQIVNWIIKCVYRCVYLCSQMTIAYSMEAFFQTTHMSLISFPWSQYENCYFTVPLIYLVQICWWCRRMLRMVHLDRDSKSWIEWSSGAHRDCWISVSSISLKISLKTFVLRISSSHL